MEFPFWLLAVFLFLLGCCIGSFLNVVIWRLPHYGSPIRFGDKIRPLTLSFPPSHCPHCHTPIRARYNIPVIGYLLLRGRCSGCREPISARYPMVELGTGLIFLAIFTQQHAAGYHHTILLGLPGLLLKLFFAATLLATAGIDADTFQIPLILPQIVMGGAIVVGFFGIQPGLAHVNPSEWLGRAAWGGTCGLILALAGLKWGLLPRSFDTVPEGSATAPEMPVEKAPQTSAVNVPPPNAAGGTRARMLLATAAAIISAVSFFCGAATEAAVILASGLLVFLIGVLPQPEANIELSQEVMDETREPDVRREVLKELLFFVIPAAGAVIAIFLPLHLPAWRFMPALTGVMAGLLVGGGLIWITRIIGSLVLGRQAMGLGDVPLMAAIGAVVGAAHAVLAFFIAPFAALIWAIFLMIRRRPNVLPYGPWLVTAGIIVLLSGQSILHLYFHTFIPRRPHHTHVFHWPGQR
ncbi:MAG: prepilin peptidase [Phycisphaerae bacterium]